MVKWAGQTYTRMLITNLVSRIYLTIDRKFWRSMTLLTVTRPAYHWVLVSSLSETKVLLHTNSQDPTTIDYQTRNLGRSPSSFVESFFSFWTPVNDPGLSGWSWWTSKFLLSVSHHWHWRYWTMVHGAFKKTLIGQLGNHYGGFGERTGQSTKKSL